MVSRGVYPLCDDPRRGLFLALTAVVALPAIGIAQAEYPAGSPLTRYPVYDSPFFAVAVIA